MDAFALAEVGRAVADPTRNEVLSLSNGRLSISDIGRLIGVSKATASYHVKVLAQVGLVEVIKSGRCHRPRRAPRGVRVLLMELSRDPG
jgi:DNA-binding transcriptional ArsR family regulator